MAIASDSEIVPVRYGDAISLYCDDGPGFVYTQVTRYELRDMMERRREITASYIVRFTPALP